MTLQEIKAMLDRVGVPVAYHHFLHAQEPPFLVYYHSGTNNIGADNKIWQKISRLTVELYTEKKEAATEEAVEAVLNEACIFWDKTEIWIESERLYQISYESEVMG